MNQKIKNESDLDRSLTYLDLVMMGIGASIGSGIFIITGIAAKQAGPGIFISFFIAATVCIFNGLCHSELASKYPVAGSAYVYAYVTWGEYVALVITLNLLIDYHIGAAIIARAFSSYLQIFLQQFGANLPYILTSIEVNSYISINLMAPIILSLITFVLCMGVKEGSTLNIVLASTKILLIVIIVLAGIFNIESSHLTPLAPMGVNSIFLTAGVVFYSYTGFDAISNAAEEIVNPKRDIPLAITTCLGVCALLYAAVSLVICGLVPWQEISESAPLSSAFSQYSSLNWVQYIINSGALIGLFTTLLVGMYSQSRIYLSLARDDLFPHCLAIVNAKYKTPINAQVLCGIIAILIATLFDVNELSHMLSIGVILTYTCTCCIVIYENVYLHEDIDENVDLDGQNNHGYGIENENDWDFNNTGNKNNNNNNKNKVKNDQNKNTVLVSLCCILLTTSMIGLSVKNGYNMYLTISLVVLMLLETVPIFYLVQRGVVTRDDIYVCPLVPFVPLVGIVSNAYLASQLYAEAWIRVAIVALGLYFMFVVRYFYQDLEKEKDNNNNYKYSKSKDLYTKRLNVNEREYKESQREYFTEEKDLNLNLKTKLFEETKK